MQRQLEGEVGALWKIVEPLERRSLRFTQWRMGVTGKKMVSPVTVSCQAFRFVSHATASP
jgi:hypothetical protein